MARSSNPKGFIKLQAIAGVLPLLIGWTTIPKARRRQVGPRKSTQAR
jgi:hypothetical protein